MSGPILLFSGTAAAVGGWMLTRRVAGAHGGHLRWLALDASVPVTLFVLLTLLTARPMFAGLLTLAMGIGFAYADHAKRRSLREPIVFTDIFQAVDVFRHPRIATPFPNRLRIASSALAVCSAVVLLFLVEPAIDCGWPWSPLLMVLLVAAVTRVLFMEGGAGLARNLLRDGLTGDPAADARRFGAIASLIGHGLSARLERIGRAAHRAPPATLHDPVRQPRVPVVLVQCESFFDARRLDPAIDTGLLPNYDRTCATALQWGRLAVPCWGANTVRTEFAVLCGLEESELGFDRFNPYHRFARRPLDSLAWRLRAAGYATICVHPFDRRFYNRDIVMPLLGFEHFIGDEAFAKSDRVNGYVADLAIADAIETLLGEAGRPTFVFAITIENHGPWPQVLPPKTPRRAAGVDLAGSDANALEHYLSSLVNSDAMLGALTKRDDNRLLGFFGDHQPSLALMPKEGHDSDYLLWQAGTAGGGSRRDLAAHDLGFHLRAALGIQPAR